MDDREQGDTLRPWPVDPAAYPLDTPRNRREPNGYANYDYEDYARAAVKVAIAGVIGIAALLAVCIGIGAAFS
jgi:hypothetical protein